MKTIDDSRNAFEDYKEQYKIFTDLDLSESDTRSKLIDSILIGVLGWDEADIKREGHVDSGYFDYKVSIPGLHFLVEAKRQFKEFSLPTKHKRASINSLLGENKDAIMQIRNYCQDEGIQFGIITNGYQFILIKSYNVDGKPWKENSCLIFNGIEDIESRFVEFYENLSKFALIHTGGFKFDLPLNNIEYKTVLSSLIDRDKELIRNSLSAAITPLIDKVFGEIFSEEREDDKEFITYCFVENEETKKNKSEIERLFVDLAPELNRVIPAVNTSSISTQISQELVNDEINLKSSYPPKPIIIIGSKGAGKTTFINHLFKYRLSGDEIENHFTAYVDFRLFYESANSFEPDKLASVILERIYSKYEDLELHSLRVLKRIYFKEIKRNDESIWSYDHQNDQPAYHKGLAKFLQDAKENASKHLEFLSKYLIRERRKRLIIIIDNVDQFNDKIQERLFVFAHSLTKASLCGTVISLREGYYYKWQNSPPFDAYESNVYHITAPSYIEVLQRRINFALEKAPAFEDKVRGANEKGFNVEFPANYLTNFLSSLKTSLFSERNRQLIDYLSHTTYPNIREGLRVFKSFLISGHTKVSEYILREQFREDERAPQTIPIHEFIKSIGLQNRHYYNAEISMIFNLLIPGTESTDHFLKIYILKDLNDLIEKKSYTDRFIPNRIVVEKLNSLGYRANSINSAITSLLNSSLIDTDEQITDVDWTELPSNYNLCITSKGHYYLKNMINKFHYYDLILQDTPIFDQTYFDRIRAAFPASHESGMRALDQRLSSARIFLGYLKLMESKQPSQVKAVYGLLLGSIEEMLKPQLGRLDRIIAEQ